ncbi:MULTISPECIES: hypothetical protein [unclassified Streptomyces]|uniref:hypothetical protein n=1 Tax=unclassified Streptomyces TaxID=2593676 RepID=UPI0036920353
MGIESDQLVFDYLSRVGDVAQQRHLPASDRARLVSELRDEIDRRRAGRGGRNPAAVQGILGALGTPDEVVDRVGRTDGPDAGRGRPDGADGRPDTPVEGAPAPGPEMTKASVPRPRTGGAPADEDDGPAAGGETDWWRAGEPEALPPGFFGGIEAPELFAPPVPEEDEEESRDPEEDGGGKRRRLSRLLRRRRPAGAPEAVGDAAPAAGAVAVEAARGRPLLANPFLLLAALLLLGGAAFGSLLALAAGWLLAYASRRLTPAETRTAVLVLPGLAAAGGIAWLWGRVDGRWGAPLAQGGEAMGVAIGETWPWVLRGAAVASALFLIWRSRTH